MSLYPAPPIPRPHRYRRRHIVIHYASGRILDTRTQTIPAADVHFDRHAIRAETEDGTVAKAIFTYPELDDTEYSIVTYELLPNHTP